MFRVEMLCAARSTRITVADGGVPPSSIIRRVTSNRPPRDRRSFVTRLLVDRPKGGDSLSTALRRICRSDPNNTGYWE